MKVDPEKAFSDHLHKKEDWYDLMHGADMGHVLSLVWPSLYDSKLEEFQSDSLHQCSICQDWFDYEGDLENGICQDCREDIEEEKAEKAELQAQPSPERHNMKPQDRRL